MLLHHGVLCGKCGEFGAKLRRSLVTPYTPEISVNWGSWILNHVQVGLRLCIQRGITIAKGLMIWNNHSQMRTKSNTHDFTDIPQRSCTKEGCLRLMSSLTRDQKGPSQTKVLHKTLADWNSLQLALAVLPLHAVVANEKMLGMHQSHHQEKIKQ